MRYGIRDIVDVEVVDVATKKPLIYFESLKTSTTEVVTANVAARGGRGNPKRIVWESDKDVTFNCEDCVVSPQGLALLFGNSLVTGATAVPIAEIVASTSADTLVLAATPVVTATNIMTVYTTTDRSTPETEYTLGSISNPNEYTLTGNTVSLPAATVTGTLFLVSYYKTSSALNKKITIASDKFAGTYKITGSSLMRAEDATGDYPCRIVIPKAKLLSSITINQAATGDPTVFPWKFLVLKDMLSSTLIEYNVETDTPIVQ